MRRIVALFLILLLCNQTILKLGILAWYQTNKDYIAKNLCENRNHPELKCCGKCQFRKKLAQADHSSLPSQASDFQVFKGKLAPFILPVPIQYTICESSQDLPEPYYLAAIPSKLAFPVFHPPA